MAMFRRIKILTSLLQEFGENLDNTRIHSLLFLLCKEKLPQNNYYDFIHSKEFPHSIQAEEDKKYLINKNILKNTEEWISITNKRFATELDFFEKIAIQELKNKFLSATNESLNDYIKANHPANISLSDEFAFYTIGYEGSSPEMYVNELLDNNIKLLCDVRKNPLSKKFGFSKSELSKSLQSVGIEYMHIPELGIHSDKRQSLETESDYIKLFKEYENTILKEQTAKLSLLQNLLQEKKRIALTCFEENPFFCHRYRVAEALEKAEKNIKIIHLRPCQKKIRA
jgi:uncharacterized protein (DUF488 family)